MNKRILFINNSSYLGKGTSASLLLLLRTLRNKYDCSVVSDKHSRQLPEALEKMGIRYWGLPDRFLAYLPALVILILRGRYDLVYANGSNERSRGAFWAAKLTKRPIIWHIRESLATKKYARTIHHADRVIAISNDTAERLRKFAGVLDPILISNGVDLQEFDLDRQSARKKLGISLGLEPDWNRIINIGRICKRKNQAGVIPVAQEVIARFPKTYFILVGPAEQDTLLELKSKVVQLDLQKNILFHDYTPDVGNYLCGSDLLLHTAGTEPQGRVILEAMAARLPVVAYNVGGVGESVIDGQTGFLRTFGDVDGLSQAVCQMIADPAGRTRMGEAGYDCVRKQFSARRTALAVQEVIDQVLQKESSG
jgi:glycosyltransferase involved in cell wall biosynthesis